jgi:hypothetical protein
MLLIWCARACCSRCRHSAVRDPGFGFVLLADRTVRRLRTAVYYLACCGRLRCQERLSGCAPVLPAWKVMRTDLVSNVSR